MTEQCLSCKFRFVYSNMPDEPDDCVWVEETDFPHPLPPFLTRHNLIVRIDRANPRDNCKVFQKK